MSKMSKAIAVLGVVAGLGVAALPLSTYAASKNAQVQVMVDGAISINLVDPVTDGANSAEGVSFDKEKGLLDLGTIQINGAIAEGTMGVQVATNSINGYTLSVKAAGTSDMVGTDDAEGFVIPANADIANNKAGWALKGGIINAWTAPSTTDTATLKETTTAIDSETLVNNKKAETTDVTFGVSADSTTHEGKYVGTVVFTATAN